MQDSEGMVNVSRLSAGRRHQQSGLVVCVHGGEVFFQINDPNTRHAWHGDVDRVWGTLQTVYQTLRVSQFSGSKCFQFSGRDDQKQNIVGVGDGFGLPAFVWHLGSANEPGDSSLLETSVVPWPRDYRAEECCREAAKAQRSRSHFLWPEPNYFGELVRWLPPIPTLHSLLVPSVRASRAAAGGGSGSFTLPPWEKRRDTMRYRGSSVTPTRQHILHCARHSADLANASAQAAAFFGRSADFGQIAWKGGEFSSDHDQDAAKGRDVEGRGVLPHSSLLAFSNHKHVLWLPGGADWSMALARLTLMGAALYMPRDMRASHSLYSHALLELCRDCVVGFRRGPPRGGYLATDFLPYGRKGTLALPPVLSAGSICVSLSDAFMSATAEPVATDAVGGVKGAHERATRLSQFVEDELHPICAVRYMAALLRGLRQTVVDAERLAQIARDNSGRGARGELSAGGASFRRFDCAFQHAHVRRLQTAYGPNTAPRAVEAFASWFDEKTCESKDLRAMADEEGAAVT